MTAPAPTAGAKAAADVAALLRARNSLLWIVTREEARAEQGLAEAARAAQYEPLPEGTPEVSMPAPAAPGPEPMATTGTGIVREAATGKALWDGRLPYKSTGIRWMLREAGLISKERCEPTGGNV